MPTKYLQRVLEEFERLYDETFDVRTHPEFPHGKVYNLLTTHLTAAYEEGRGVGILEAMDLVPKVIKVEIMEVPVLVDALEALISKK